MRARNSGVPVDRVKTALFMLTAAAAALVAILTVLDAGSTDARRGFQKEFEAIIAAVIGGCLLTGGYGSAIGAFFGAIIFGMVLHRPHLHALRFRTGSRFSSAPCCCSPCCSTTSSAAR